MKRMPDVLNQLLDALNATGIPFAAEAWNEKPDGNAYGVVSIGSDAVLMGSDSIAERISNGTVHLFTFGDGFDAALKVENVLYAHTDVFRPESRRFVNDFGVLHWQWSFGVI